MKKILLSLFLLGVSLPTAFATHYEVTLPLFTDSQSIPYNTIRQWGQTKIFGGNILFGDAFAFYEFQKETLTDINIVDKTIKRPITIESICVSPTRDGIPLWEYAVTAPNTLQPPEQDARSGDFWTPVSFARRKLQIGSIDSHSGTMILTKTYIPSGRQIAAIGTCSNDGYDVFRPGDLVQSGNTLTYRVQFPTGTPIRVRTSVINSSYQNLTLHSTYNANNANGFFLMWISPVNINSAKSLTITSLSGSSETITPKSGKNIKQILQDRYPVSYPVSEFFPIPSDTATLKLLF